MIGHLAELARALRVAFRRSRMRLTRHMSRCGLAVMEGRRQKAEAELAKYLRGHKHSLSDELRIELERRCTASGRQA
jgi:hypothetical protein